MVASLLAALLLAGPMQAAGTPTLGTAAFAAGLPSSRGFGAVQPRRVYLGGVPSGDWSRLVWRNWGAAVATASGRGYESPPSTCGGACALPTRSQLRASQLGSCGDLFVYRKLKVRLLIPKTGGRWSAWADIGKRYGRGGLLCEPAG